MTLGIILIVLLILLDQITKIIIDKTMNYGESITIIKDFFILLPIVILEPHGEFSKANYGF